MNLVDTSGWIEYFFGGPNAAFFAAPIEDVQHLIVPVICLYEVFKKVNIVADEARGLQAVAQMKQGRIVDVTEDVALSGCTHQLETRTTHGRQPDLRNGAGPRCGCLDSGRPLPLAARGEVHPDASPIAP